MRRCINCRLCVAAARIGFSVLESLPASVVSLLLKWKSVKKLPGTSILCQPCLNLASSLLSQQKSNVNPDRVYGHTNVCLGCGKYLSTVNSNESGGQYVLDYRDPELGIILSWDKQNEILEGKPIICFNCLTKAKLNLKMLNNKPHPRSLLIANQYYINNANKLHQENTRQHIPQQNPINKIQRQINVQDTLPEEEEIIYSPEQCLVKEEIIDIEDTIIQGTNHHTFQSDQEEQLNIEETMIPRRIAEITPQSGLLTTNLEVVQKQTLSTLSKYAPGDNLLHVKQEVPEIMLPKENTLPSHQPPSHLNHIVKEEIIVKEVPEQDLVLNITIEENETDQKDILKIIQPTSQSNELLNDEEPLVEFEQLPKDYSNQLTSEFDPLCIKNEQLSEVTFSNYQKSQQQSNLVDSSPEDNFTKINLSRFKRCANTSSRCIFQNCKIKSQKCVPAFIKFKLLKLYKLYVPENARICKKHIDTNEWHLLKEKPNHLNVFTNRQIEDILGTALKASDLLDFENVHTMPDDMCRYWTGLTIDEFLSLYSNMQQLQNMRQGKTKLAVYLTKQKTKQSNTKLSMLYRIPRTTLEHRLKRIKKLFT